jgi:hypothetical protein
VSKMFTLFPFARYNSGIIYEEDFIRKNFFSLKILELNHRELDNLSGWHKDC